MSAGSQMWSSTLMRMRSSALIGLVCAASVPNGTLPEQTENCEGRRNGAEPLHLGGASVRLANSGTEHMTRDRAAGERLGGRRDGIGGRVFRRCEIGDAAVTPLGNPAL